MTKVRSLFLVFMVLWQVFAVAQGSGHALDFTQGNYDYDSPTINHNIGTGDFTMECWVKPGVYGNTGEGVFANGNYAPAFYWKSRTNQGGAAGGSVAFYWGSWRNSGGFVDPTRWNHIAAVRESDTVRFYVNGVEAPNKFYITTSVPNAFFTIGNSNDNEPLNGHLDEVRYWSSARSLSQLQANMCQKLDTTGLTDLIAYYTFNEGIGATVGDHSRNGNHITDAGIASYWAKSGAAIGDVSVFTYPTTWAAQNLTYASAAHGSFEISNVTGSPLGAHLYFVKDKPLDSNGISALAGNSGYFGTYMVEVSATAKYDYKYDYTSHLSAAGLKNSINLFSRPAADNMWAISSAVNNTTTLALASNDSINGEYIIGNFLASCAVPTALAVQNLAYTSVDLSWATGGSSLWNVEYGVTGFTPGTGVIVKANTSNPFSVTGLTDNTVYQFYVQDSCMNVGTSIWAGPFSFTTLQITPCVAPTGFTALAGYSDIQLSWITGGSNEWNIEYGPTGFTPGTGTKLSNVSSNPLAINGLSSTTTYDFYVQDTCNSINASAWVGPITAATQAVPVSASAGAGTALYFAGTSANEHLNMGSGINTAIDTTDFTIEWWMKGEAMSSDPAIIGNKNWNSGTNPGIIVARTSASTIKVNTQIPGGSRTDMTVAVPGLQSAWNHIALVYDRHSTHPDYKVYVNGVVADSVSLAAANPTGSMGAVFPMRAGQDGTGTYGGKFKGVMDEIRVWNEARTETQIRANMCHTLSGSETGLIANYRLNEGTGIIAGDQTASYAGTATNGPQWVSSGAAIGDTSVYVYPANGAVGALSINSVGNGNISIDSLQNAAAGVHLYRVDRVPAGVNGIKALATNNTYFGVFAAHDTALEYNLTYAYGTYPLAVTNEDSLMIFNRLGGEVAYWNNVNARRLKTNDEIKKSSVSGYRNEFILSNFVSYNCSAPSLGSAANMTFNSADLSWVSGGASIWDVEYGVAGFVQGNGAVITGISNNPYTLTGLQSTTGYEFYVRDNCGTQGNSAWVGPFSFTTTVAPACPVPTNLAATNIGIGNADISWITGGSGLWNLQYGPTGFILGTGTVIDSVYNNPFNLSGLNALTTYDVYVQDTCNFVNSSAWVGPITFTTLKDFRQTGAGMALDFKANGKIYASAGKQSAVALGLPDSTLTLEAWFKPSAFGQWKSIISFIQDNGSFERGFDLETRDNNKFGFAIKAKNNSSLTYLETTNQFNTNQWYHIAGTYDGDTMKIYVNGVLEGVSTSQSGAIDYADSWLTLGSYKDDNEDNMVTGQMDEVKIWKVERSIEEIREMMCQKMTGNEAGLMSYFPLNEGSGNAVTDLGPDANHGTFAGLPQSAWVASGAAIGDTSVYVYTQNYSTVSLNLASADRGEVTIDSIQNTPAGMHLYFVDTIPNYTAGIDDLSDQKVFFGTFVAEGSNMANYNLTYDYSNYGNATVNEVYLNIYNRLDASYTTWINTGAARNAAADEVKLTSSSDRKEIILADFKMPACAAPSALTTVNVQFFYADVAWTSGGATAWNVEYGKTGFNLGVGTTQVITGVPATTLSGLNHSTTYDYYVQDSCNATDQSSWVGPFTFTTKNICPELDSMALKAVTGNSATFDIYSQGTNRDWDIQWGPTGYPIGLGIVTKVSGNPANLLNLSNSTTYDVYIRANCDSLNSGWTGPITFTTDSTGSFSVNENDLAEAMKVYPNPSQGSFTLEVEHGEAFAISISDISGKTIYRQSQIGGGIWKKQMDWSEMPKGVYLITLNSKSGQRTQKLIID